MSTIHRPIDVLLFAPHPDFGGGVLEFGNTLTERFGTAVRVETFRIGLRPGRLNKTLRVVMPFLDVFRLLVVLLTRKHHVYHINPSMNARSVLRDGLFLLVFRLFPKRRVLVYFHGWDSDYFASIMRRNPHRAIFRGIYGRASLVTVLASEFKKGLQSIGIHPELIRVTTTMFDGKLLESTQRDRNDDDVWILFLGRLVVEKGVFALLDAFSQLSRESSRLKLIIAGDGPDAISLRNRCTKYGLEDRVVFLGQVRYQQKAQLLVDSDIFALPSNGEGCPIALLEAMAAGLPVVVTPVGGVPDIIIHGKNGYVIHQGDIGALARSIAQLASDQELRATMGRQNRDEAWYKYEAGPVLAELRTFYSELLGPI